jgi:hypothetical protein
MKVHSTLLILTIIILVSVTVWSQTEVEIAQMPGFPITLDPPESGTGVWNWYGAVLADLDGDGDQEMIFSGSFEDSSDCSELCCDNGVIWAWDHQGGLLPGFPVSTTAAALFAPSIGDLDGDGTQEIVQVLIDIEWNASILAVDHHGAPVPGFPIDVTHPDIGWRMMASWQAVATLYDLDLDGQLEIIYPSIDTVHVFETDGTQWGQGWPVDLGRILIDGERVYSQIQGSTPAVADMDGDGVPEVFITSYLSLHMFEATGENAEGWPIALPENSHVPQASTAVADLDGDTDLEVIFPVFFDLEDSENPSQLRIYAYHHDGTILDGWPRWVGPPHNRPLSHQCSPLVTDLEGDGKLEVLMAASSDRDESGALLGPKIYAWDSQGRRRAGFPVETSIPVFNIIMLTAADVDGDGSMEIFADPGGRFGAAWDGFGQVIGIDADGQSLPGFPLRPEGDGYGNGAIIGDVDADGDYEIAVVGMMAGEDRKQTTINLYDLTGSYLASERDWRTYHSVNARGGVYKRSYRGWRVVHAGSRRGGGR